MVLLVCRVVEFPFFRLHHFDWALRDTVVGQPCRPIVCLLASVLAFSCVLSVNSAPVSPRKMVEDVMKWLYSVCVWFVPMPSNNIFHAFAILVCLASCCIGNSPIMRVSSWSVQSSSLR